MSNSQIKVNQNDPRSMFGDLKLKVNLGDRNKTPNRFLIEKMKSNRKSSALANDIVINQTFINNSSFNQSERG